MSWKARALSNLAPHSMEQEDLKVMLAEWFYTGDAYDLETGCEDCELCDHANIRYQFVIENEHTHQQLLVGSECIKRVGISSIDADGSRTSSERAAEQVDRDRSKLITDAKQKRVISSLIELAASEEDDGFKIESFISYYCDRGAFTPNQLATLIWRLEKCECKYKRSDFKMIIRRNREKEQLRMMEEWKVGKIWRCMSSSQRDWCIENDINAS